MQAAEMQATTTGALPFIARHLGDSLGVPTRLRQFVSNHRDLYVPLQAAPRSVAEQSVVQWHNWRLRCGVHAMHHQAGTYQYWDATPHTGASLVHRRDLEAFTTETVTENWSCDIRTVVGLSASRARLERFLTLDEMAETVFPETLHPISEDGMREHLGKGWYHGEIAGITDAQKRTGRFRRYMWDEGRIYLANSTDMHPLVAARYIAGRLQKSIPLYGTLHTHGIDVSAARSLAADFDIYAMPDSLMYGPFLDAMRMFRAGFGIYGVPRGAFDGGGKANARKVDLVLLARKDSRAMRVSGVLREAGFFDARRFIMETADRQAVT